MIRSLALGLSLAALSFASAQAAPAKWAVDAAGSRLGFSSKYSGDAFTGMFRRWNADIAFDPAQLPASKIVVTVDMASVTTNDPDRDETLPTGEWFDTKKFPRAVFTSTAIKAAGPGKYTAAGTLNLKGVTRPATLNFALKITGDKADANGTVTIDRGQFGVGQGQFKGGDAVPLAVGVGFNVKATKVK
jgi:polyisoprenoid-binding protein YceI